MAEDNALSIRLGPGLMTLYHLGYIAEDIGKVIILSRSPPEIGNPERSVVGGASHDDPLEIWRYDPRFKSEIESLKIRVREGSIELILLAATLITSIVVPLVVYRAQGLAQSEITIEVRCSHPLVRPLLQRYEAGEFGFDQNSIYVFFGHLSRIGVDVKTISPNAFELTSIVERYSMRVSKLLRVKLPKKDRNL